MLQALDLHKTYFMGKEEIHALKGITFSFETETMSAFVGPSGSGKSSLLHLLAGIDLPTKGEVHLNGKTLSGLSEAERTRVRLRQIGLVFQRFFLLPYLTAEENIELPLLEAGVKRQERKKRTRELLNLFELENRANHRPWQISGGEKQRIAIARALANNPPIILADEPTGELDEANTKRIGTILKNLAKEGKIVVLATHNLELAQQANQVILLRDGKIEKK
ncbi:MAG: ABC transporter ATP-binding protein [Candidatus Eremiobacteraeota bacterium]|jgi:putative ABC transport system ATP-binding protein|nr:ABC transporter ATP-binding protein [Candidatus Eremiobacteraeota bacterium]MCL5055732.1 ABC transporter ATP-binding protein [Bacillota bacterium]